MMLMSIGVVSAAYTELDNYTGGITSNIATDGTYLYFGNGDNVVKVNAATMEYVAQYTYAGDGYTFYGGTPYVSGGYIYIGQTGWDLKRVFRINANTMALSGSYTGPDAMYSPYVSGSYVYVYCANGYVYQLNAATMGYVNRALVSEYIEGTQGTPIVSGSYLYAGRAKLNPTTLAIQSSYLGTAGWIQTTPIVKDFKVYTGWSNGAVFRWNDEDMSLDDSYTMYGGVNAGIYDNVLYADYVYFTDGNTVTKFDVTNMATNTPLSIEAYSLAMDSYGILYADGNQINTTTMTVIPSTLPYGASGYIFDGDTVYFGAGGVVYKGDVSPAPVCAPNWSCTGYDVCQVGDVRYCDAVVDLNNCGSSYVGDYSEFTPLACDYCTPLWQCNNYGVCQGDDNMYCTGVTDLIVCEETYLGDLSEFTQSCSYCVENWTQYNTACVASQYTQLYADLNNCGTTIDLPTNPINGTVVSCLSQGRSSGGGGSGSYVEPRAENITTTTQDNVDVSKQYKTIIIFIIFMVAIYYVARQSKGKKRRK